MKNQNKIDKSLDKCLDIADEMIAILNVGKIKEVSAVLSDKNMHIICEHCTTGRCKRQSMGVYKCTDCGGVMSTVEEIKREEEL